jgi:hypothetical protein
MNLPRPRFRSSPVNESEFTTSNAGYATLFTELGRCESFENFSGVLKAGLEERELNGCFLMSCFGFNRETRFGRWPNRYVFPLISDLSDRSSVPIIRDGLIIVSSGYFTIVLGHAEKLMDSNPSIADSVTMLAEFSRLWLKSFNEQIDQGVDTLKRRKIYSNQLLDVVKQLDESCNDVTAAHCRVIAAINSDLPENIQGLGLSAQQFNAILDQFDEFEQSYALFTQQQMELYRRLKEQVRAIAEYLMHRSGR